jgi:hypothetical protein
MAFSLINGKMIFFPKIVKKIDKIEKNRPKKPQIGAF